MLEGVGSRRGGCRADKGGPRRVRDAARHPSTGLDPKKPHCQGAGTYSVVIYPAWASNPGSSVTCRSHLSGLETKLECGVFKPFCAAKIIFVPICLPGGFRRRSPQPSSDLAAPSRSTSLAPR